MGVREGAPLPDISTPEAFKQTLLKARGKTRLLARLAAAGLDYQE